MATLAQSETSDCSSPVLDIFTQVNGVLTDVFSLEFQIFDVTSGSEVQVFPMSGRQTVDVGTTCPSVGAGRISVGHYVAEWTVPVDESVGLHRIRWFFKLLSGSTEQQFEEDFQVLQDVAAASAFGYTTVSAMRAEGVTAAKANDARLQKLINMASRYVDKVTGRFFEPRERVYTLDGQGAGMLFLQEPIIGVSRIRVGFAGDFLGVQGVASDSYRVYNRHLSQGLERPDDRDDPRIALIAAELETTSVLLGGFERWPLGHQNIEVTGVFGYTDFDGVINSQGKTPDLIELVTQKIVVRMLPKVASTDAAFDAAQGFRIKSLRTRDQTITYQDMILQGAFTGDPEIDTILAGYARPPDLAMTR